jgi:hypothetical protein
LKTHVADKHEKEAEKISQHAAMKRSPENLARYTKQPRGRVSLGNEFRSRMGYSSRDGSAPEFDKDK